MEPRVLTISITIAAPLPAVWEAYNSPDDIKQWNQASPDWHCPASENNLVEGGRFRNTMAAKDGSFSFDFSGVYNKIVPHTLLEFTLDDNRKVSVNFKDNGESTTVTTRFEAENENPADMQRDGWQAILNSFKNHVENKQKNAVL